MKKNENRLSRRKREQIRHRDEILDAALRLFARAGYHNVTMQQIAEAAEFAVGTLYKFFESKEELYKALLVDNGTRYYEILREVLTSSHNSTRETIEDFLSAKAHIFSENSALLQLYFSQTQGVKLNLKAGLTQELDALNDKIMQMLSAVMQAGIDEKILRPLPPHQLALALEGISNAFFFDYLTSATEGAYAKCVSRIMEIFMEGVQR